MYLHLGYLLALKPSGFIPITLLQAHCAPAAQAFSRCAGRLPMGLAMLFPLEALPWDICMAQCLVSSKSSLVSDNLATLFKIHLSPLAISSSTHSPILTFAYTAFPLKTYHLHTF